MLPVEPRWVPAHRAQERARPGHVLVRAVAVLSIIAGAALSLLQLYRLLRQ